jgi:hypothetical protein
MAKGKNAKQKRKSLYRKLLTVANEVFAMACKCLKELETCSVLEAATQYEVLKGNPRDGSTLERILYNHIRQYDRALWHFSADRRYYSAKNEELLGESGVKRVSIKKPGYRSKLRKAFEKQGWFKSLQKIRAGIEGVIFGLMRGAGLKRCLWKGRRFFESYVGLSVVAFNLSKLAQLL